MKTIIKALPLVVLATLASQTAHAEIAHETKKSIAFVSSGIVGGILGGPAGFFFAGVGGSLVADAIFDDSRHDKEEPLVISEQSTPLITEELVTDSISGNQAASTDKTELTVVDDVSSESVVEVSPSETSDNSEQGAQSPALVNSVQIGLLFDTNQDQLSHSMLETIDKVTEAIKAEPNSLIRIDGYADPRGTEAFNLDLSYRRAENVANYLAEKGIDRSRIIVRSMGEGQSSSADNDYPAHVQERKVELKLDTSLAASNSPPCDSVNNSCEDS